MWKFVVTALLAIWTPASGVAADGPGPAWRDRLGFEVGPGPMLAGGWDGLPENSVSLDTAVKRSGKTSLRIERKRSTRRMLSTVALAVTGALGGKEVELRGYLRLADVQGRAGLWVRQEGGSPSFMLDGNSARTVSGTADWRRFSVRQKLEPKATGLTFGVFLSGLGVIWADDLELFIDGVLVDSEPVVTVVPVQALSRDRGE